MKVLAPWWVLRLLRLGINFRDRLSSLEGRALRVMHQLEEAARRRKIFRSTGPSTFEHWR